MKNVLRILFLVCIFTVILFILRLSNIRNTFLEVKSFHTKPIFKDVTHELNVMEKMNESESAVESAAKMNPDMNIYILYLNPTSLSNQFYDLRHRLLNYKNIKIKSIDINEYVQNTPLETWNVTSALETSYYPTAHMSDILRLLTLWKFGGIYMDLDVVVMTNLRNLTNFAGAQDDTYIANGVMGFSARGFGKDMLNECLEELKRNFRGDLWSHNGPEVITRVLYRICNATSIREMTPSRCKGFYVLPPKTFYPVYYDEWAKYFDTENYEKTMEVLKESRAIHVWNKLSSQREIIVGSNAPYALIAEKFCPKIYFNCGQTF